jgi:phospholipid transport system substrate-binding protein
MRSTHRIGSVGGRFPLHEMTRGFKILGSRSFWLMCATSLLLGTTTIPESKPSLTTDAPTDAMRTTVNQALAVLQDQDLKKPERTEERVARLKKIADLRFDYGEMAKRSLGGQWEKLEERERQEFVELFTEFLTATYVERIHAYSGEEVTFLNERVEGNHAEVKSIMVGKKTEIPMDYRLMKKGDDWKAYDVLIDGISLVQNYRGQFAAILHSSSYEHLVQVLREKIAQYNVKTRSSQTSPSSR